MQYICQLLNKKNIAALSSDINPFTISGGIFLSKSAKNVDKTMQKLSQQQQMSQGFINT
jgi:hypothetical protein